MISPTQIRMARALLNVTQTDVAEAIGVANNTFSDIEKGKSKDVPASRLQSIETYFESRGVEFLPNDGVHKREKGMMMLEGRDGFAKFRQAVIEEAKSGHCDICVSNVDERLFDKWGEGAVNDEYRSTMATIENTKFRIIVKENDNHFPAKGHAEYRWLQEQEFGDFPFYIFGSKTAIIPFEEDELSIFILDHPKITKFYRAMFEKLWHSAKSLETS